MQIAINMAMSMDGKIATAARGPVKLGTAFDSRRMAEIRALHDAVINGSATFRAHPDPLIVRGKALLQQRRRRGQSVQPISALASSKLEIPFGTPWQKARKIERWAFCGRKTPLARRLRLAAAGVHVVACPGERPTPRAILRAFQRAGVKSLLLEGGGEFNAAFLEAGLVGRIYLTLVPKLVGGKDAPTWCEGRGFKAFPQFRLTECRKVGDELYLVYDRKQRKTR